MKPTLSFIKGGPSDSDGYITGSDHYTVVDIWAEYEGDEVFEPVHIASFVKEHHENPSDIVRSFIDIAREDDAALTNFTTIERHIPVSKLKELMRDVPRFGGKL